MRKWNRDAGLVAVIMIVLAVAGSLESGQMWPLWIFGVGGFGVALAVARLMQGPFTGADKVGIGLMLAGLGLGAFVAYLDDALTPGRLLVILAIGLSGGASIGGYVAAIGSALFPDRVPVSHHSPRVVRWFVFWR